jgi:MoxR-like ATPase
MFASIDAVLQALEGCRYVGDRPLGTALYLAGILGKPLLLEGEAGVGKTEVAKVAAEALGARLIRLQCYEGLDANAALYEWNYPKQMLRIKLEEDRGGSREAIEKDIFGDEFLIRRPLLEAILADDRKPPVLLIDEVDRADEEFEAFLLEVLSDFQITIPEIGTLRARRRPLVILTSNRTREIHDALKRRCLYHWIDYPSFEKECRIVEARILGIATHLAEQVAAVMQTVRQKQLFKRPGIAETLDWAAALMALERQALDPATVDVTLGCILKHREDIDRVRAEGADLLLQQAVKAFPAAPAGRRH